MCDNCTEAAIEERNIAREALEEAIGMLMDESIVTPGSAALERLQNALMFQSENWGP